MHSKHRGPRPKIKPLNDALSLAAYSGQKTVSYALVQGPLTNQVLKVEIQIPISIAYRLYYLGRAFDGQAVKYIEPAGSTQIGFVQLQVLVSELQLIDRAVTDPVTKHYLGLLLPHLVESRTDTSTCLNIVSS